MLHLGSVFHSHYFRFPVFEIFYHFLVYYSEISSTNLPNCELYNNICYCMSVNTVYMNRKRMLREFLQTSNIT